MVHSSTLKTISLEGSGQVPFSLSVLARFSPSAGWGLQGGWPAARADFRALIHLHGEKLDHEQGRRRLLTQGIDNSGFNVQDSGLKVQKLGFRVQSSGFRVQVRVLGFEV